MGECILSRGASGGSSGNVANNGLVTEIIMSNILWHVPQNLRNNQVSVRLFGGGGAGDLAGGFGGHMNNAIINVAGETDVYILIGSGGIDDSASNSGGTTTFGQYLSANGGSAATIGKNCAGGSGGGTGYGGGGTNVTVSYGGGGGGTARAIDTKLNYSHLGYDSCNGGTYGGGGGSCKNISLGGCTNGNTSNRSGYGGNGGLVYNANNDYTAAKNGTNTIGMGLEFEGAGLAGNRSDKKTAYYNNITRNLCAPGGGGGYGGNGGNGAISMANNYANKITATAIGCGGGGGYGAHGGDGYAFVTYPNSGSNISVGGGGGGGYGGNGGTAGPNSGGGGGGYGKYGQGGGYHNINGVKTLMPAGIAAGGYGSSPKSGGSGVCILQYYLD